VLVVAGDSDYIPLVTRCKRMGREVIGLGIDGSTSSAFKKACDRFTVYDDVPGISKPKSTTPRARSAAKAITETEPTVDAADPQAAATALLVRALQLIDDKNDEEWQTNGEVKTQMLRLDPSFKEKPLGFRSFSTFLEAQETAGVIVIKPKSKANDRRLKLP
jgi:hypothetical protein